MPLVRTSRHTSKSANTIGSANYTTSSFTPSNNSIVVVKAMAMPTSGTPAFIGSALSISDSLGSLTWVPIGNTGTAPSWVYGQRAWYAVVATGASMTVTVSAGGRDVISYAVEVLDYTGYDSGTPVTGFIAGSDSDGDAAHSITLAATPTASDYLEGAVIVQDSGAGTTTQGGSFTEGYDVAESGWYHWQTQYATGLTSTSFDWADLSVGGTPFDALSFAFIVKAASAAPSFNPVIGMRRPATLLRRH